MKLRTLAGIALGLVAVAAATPARHMVVSYCRSMSSGTACEANAGKSPDPFMSVACERSCAAKVPYREDQIVSQPGAHPGDLARCPVSGVVFAVHEDSPTYTANGKSYRTCCETCVTKLRKNPGRFLAL